MIYNELLYFNNMKKELSKLYWEPDLYDNIIRLNDYYRSDKYLYNFCLTDKDIINKVINEFKDIIDEDKISEYINQNPTLKYATCLDIFRFIKKYIYKYKKNIVSKRIREKINESILFYEEELEIFRSNFVKKFEEGYFLK